MGCFRDRMGMYKPVDSIVFATGPITADRAQMFAAGKWMIRWIR